MKKISSILLAAIMVFSAISCLSVGAVSGSTADEVTDATDNTLKLEEYNGSVFSEEYELGAVVISLKKDSPSVEVLLAGFEITESRFIMHSSSGQSTYYVKFAEKTEEVVLEAIAVLNKSPYVNYAEPNYRAYLDSVETSTTIGVDPDVDLQVRKDVYENIYKGIIDVELEDIIITYFGALSDGSLILNYSYRGAGSPDVTYTETIGDYYYVFYSGDLAYVYRDHNFYNIFRAYDEGLIDDDVLDELYAFSVEYMKNPINNTSFVLYPLSEDPTEPTTQPDVTVPKETTATNSGNPANSMPDTVETTTNVNATKSPATSDTAITNNSNGTVQTGQNNLLVVFTLLLIISVAAVVFMKFKYQD